MSLLISVDPGSKLAGVAVWDDSELQEAFMVKGSAWYDTAINVRRHFDAYYPEEIWSGMQVIVERPQVYHQSKQVGDPNDLITISLMAGAVGILLGEHGAIHTVLPQAWKGSVPKPAMVERIKARLSPDEVGRVELPSAKSLQHNVWDAVGIGLHHLNRRKA